MSLDGNTFQLLEKGINVLLMMMRRRRRRMMMIIVMIMIMMMMVRMRIRIRMMSMTMIMITINCIFIFTGGPIDSNSTYIIDGPSITSNVGEHCCILMLIEWMMYHILTSINYNITQSVYTIISYHFIAFIIVIIIIINTRQS